MITVSNNNHLMGWRCTKLCFVGVMIGAIIHVSNEVMGSIFSVSQGGKLTTGVADYSVSTTASDAANEKSKVHEEPPGPLLFDRSTGWNGTTPDDGEAFCNRRANARSLCPWTAYCPRNGGVLGGALSLRGHGNATGDGGGGGAVYAPISSRVWVSLSSDAPCYQRGDPDEVNKGSVDYVLCCRDGEDEIGANIGSEAASSVSSAHDAACRGECDFPNGNAQSATLSVTKRYCLAACRSRRHGEAMSQGAEFFASLATNHADLFVKYSACLNNCPSTEHSFDADGALVIPPSATRRYCTSRCRWMLRQEAISRLTSARLSPDSSERSGNIRSVGSSGGSGSVMALERCDDITNDLQHDGLCKSVSHRQKPRVNLIVSSVISNGGKHSGLGKAFEEGMRDCPASRCQVSTSGTGHTNTSHLYVTANSWANLGGVAVTSATRTHDIEQVDLVISKKVKGGRVAVKWHEHSSPPHWKRRVKQYPRRLLACDLCDEYAEKKLSKPDGSSLDLKPLKRCIVDVFSRHTLPGPDRLPLMNPALGFDAIFVTNYTPLKERREAVRKRIHDQFGVDPVFVSDFDRQVLSDEDLECIGDTVGQQAYVGGKIHPGEYSLTLKHFVVYYYMVQHSLNNAIIMEDDGSFVKLHSNWISQDSLWQEHMTNLPSDYDILILCGVEGSFKRGTKVTEHMFLGQHSRALDMYLVSQKGARNMLRSLPIVANIDVHMNYAAKANMKDWWSDMPGHEPKTVDMSIYHVEPPMSAQLEPDGTPQRVSTYGRKGDKIFTNGTWHLPATRR